MMSIKDWNKPFGNKDYSARINNSPNKMRKLTILCMIIFLSSCRFAEKEKYLFADNYTGNIYIFSNIKNGAPKQYDDANRRIYYVFQSGILLSQFKETYGIINKTFFYSKKHGKQIAIESVPFQDDKTLLDKNKVYAFYGNDGTITFAKGNDTVGLQIITICKPKDFDDITKEPFMKIIVNSQFSPEDVTYQTLIDMRSKLDKMKLRKN